MCKQESEAEIDNTQSEEEEEEKEEGDEEWSDCSDEDSIEDDDTGKKEKNSDNKMTKSSLDTADSRPNHHEGCVDNDIQGLKDLDLTHHSNENTAVCTSAQVSSDQNRGKHCESCDNAPMAHATFCRGDSVKNSPEILDGDALIELFRSVHSGSTYTAGVTTIGLVSCHKKILDKVLINPIYTTLC